MIKPHFVCRAIAKKEKTGNKIGNYMPDICVSEQIGNCLKCADAVTLILAEKFAFTFHVSSSGAQLSSAQPSPPRAAIQELLA